jgi:hypothetical protein
MKTTALILGVLAGSLSCGAQDSSASVAGSNEFIICQNGKPVSKIRIEGVEAGGARYGAPAFIADGRRLQRYFYLLSGCQVPIENVDPMPEDQHMPFTVRVNTLAYTVGDWWGKAKIYIRDGTLYFRDGEPPSGETMRDGRLMRIEHRRIGGEKVLDEFGQRYFGVPVSAIDDPNYQWRRRSRR